jgi:cyclophilin family peptidyl-prolyl cis-trans isomerase
VSPRRRRENRCFDKDEPDMIRRLPLAGVAALLLAGASCEPAAINSGGSRPFVDAGPDRCSGEGDPVTLTAEVDGGLAATYRWTLERRPAELETAEIEIHDAGSAVAVTEALVVHGEYVFRVIVADGKNRSRSSWVTITVGPPGAGGDFCVGMDGPTSLNVGEEGTFTATTDRVGDLLYHWEEVATNGVVFGSPDEDTTTVTSLTAGDVTIRVVVTDQQTGEAGTNEQTISIAELGQLTVSIEGADEAILDQRIELTAVTTNALGTLEYAWTVLAGSADLDGEDQPTVGVTPTEAGSLRIQVEVSDADTGRTASATKTIAVSETGELAVTATAEAPLLRVEDSLELSASADTTGDLQYDWEVLDGPGTLSSATAPAPTLMADGPGTIRVQVTATATEDGETRTGIAEVVVVSYEADDANPKPWVTIDVADFGTIGLALEVEAAPNTVANFLRYVDEGFYDGVLFHRVIPDFVIQAGGYVAKDDSLEHKEATRPPVASEAPNGLSNTRGTVAIALRGQDADSGDTQFFINLVDSSYLDTGPPPFTVFALVVEGMDVVDAISAVETGDRDNLTDVPLDNVVMTTIRRVPLEEVQDRTEPDDSGTNGLDSGTNGLDGGTNGLAGLNEQGSQHRVVATVLASVTGSRDPLRTQPDRNVAGEALGVRSRGRKPAGGGCDPA